MNVNDLPRAETYDLVKNKLSIFQKLPLKKIFIGSLVLITLVAGGSVIFILIGKKEISKAQPGKSADSVPTRSPTFSAGSSSNPFASLLKNSQKEASTPAESVLPPSSSNISEATLKKAIEASLKLTDLEINEKSVGNVSGCKMNGSYLGRVKGGNYYGRSENIYSGQESRIKCQSLGLLETFSETFWIGSEIYNRNLKDKSFSKVTPGSSPATSQKVSEYLQFYFSDIGKIKMLSSAPSKENIMVTASLSRPDLEGQFVFILSKPASKIIGFSFDLTSKIEGATITAVISGDVSYTAPSAAISTPDLQ